MKNIVLACALLLTVSYVWAQQTYFNAGNFNKDLPGKILTKTGEVKDATITYEHPDFLKLMKRPLLTSNGPIDKSTLDAFQVDNRTWVFRKTPTGTYWVILQRQGAIEVFDYLTSDSKGTITNVITVGSVIKKGDTQLVNSELMIGFKKKMTPLVSDHAELAAKVGGSGYGFLQYLNVVDEYNTWYEKNNPDKVVYLAAGLGLLIPGGQQAKNFSGAADMKSQAQANQSQQAAENKQKLDDAFANRSTSVSPELASAKDNVPLKKETFGAKVSRIQADGNKIGVRLILQPARTVQQETGTVQLVNYAPVEGSFTDESLLQAGQQFVEELKARYGASNIELIDIINIPYRDVKVMGMTTRVDDWWATKYKVVFTYTIDPRLEPANQEVEGKVKFTVTVNTIQTLMVTEYVGATTSTKQDILAQVLNFGGFRTPTYAQEEEIKEAKEMYDKAVSKLGMSMLDKVKAERADAVAKLVEKKLAK